MRWSEKFGVQGDVALLYDFANSLDLQRYVEHGAAHDPGDELATPAQLKDWLRTRGLLKKGARVSPVEHREALQLRDALRTFLAAAPANRTSTVGRLAVAAARLRRPGLTADDMPVSCHDGSPDTRRKGQGRLSPQFKIMFAQVTPMDVNRMFKLAQGLAAAKSRQDVAAALKLLDEDMVLEAPAFGTKSRGLAENEAALAKFFRNFPDYNVELEDHASNGKPWFAGGPCG